jgi:hypothetical protein
MDIPSYSTEGTHPPTPGNKHFVLLAYMISNNLLLRSNQQSAELLLGHPRKERRYFELLKLIQEINASTNGIGILYN